MCGRDIVSNTESEWATSAAVSFGKLFELVAISVLSRSALRVACDRGLF